MFAGVEKFLLENFLLRLFFGKSKFLTPLVENLSTMPVKKAGTGLENTATYVKGKLPSSQCESTELIWLVIVNTNPPLEADFRLSGWKGVTDKNPE